MVWCVAVLMDISDILPRLQKVRREGAQWKASCPAHSDSSPSLAIRFVDGQALLYCHAGCSRQSIMEALSISPFEARSGGPRYSKATTRPDPTPVSADLQEALLKMQRSLLVNTEGLDYIKKRGIPAVLAVSKGIGYAPEGCWPHYYDPKDGGERRLCRQVHPGRIAFAHSKPAGEVVNIYGRAASFDIERDKRHDHLPGNRGIFNAADITAAIKSLDELWVTEGPFDALAALAAGAPHAVAIFGLSGWRPEWAFGVHRLMIALDNDEPGRKAAFKLQRSIGSAIPNVRVLESKAYRDGKDLNEALLNGALRAHIEGR